MNECASLTLYQPIYVWRSQKHFPGTVPLCPSHYMFFPVCLFGKQKIKNSVRSTSKGSNLKLWQPKRCGVSLNLMKKRKAFILNSAGDTAEGRLYSLGYSVHLAELVQLMRTFGNSIVHIKCVCGCVCMCVLFVGNSTTECTGSIWDDCSSFHPGNCSTKRKLTFSFQFITTKACIVSEGVLFIALSHIRSPVTIIFLHMSPYVSLCLRLLCLSKAPPAYVSPFSYPTSILGIRIQTESLGKQMLVHNSVFTVHHSPTQGNKRSFHIFVSYKKKDGQISHPCQVPPSPAVILQSMGCTIGAIHMSGGMWGVH